jgi:hypothetical protein
VRCEQGGSEIFGGGRLKVHGVDSAWNVDTVFMFFLDRTQCRSSSQAHGRRPSRKQCVRDIYGTKRGFGTDSVNMKNHSEEARISSIW